MKRIQARDFAVSATTASMREEANPSFKTTAFKGRVPIFNSALRETKCRDKNPKSEKVLKRKTLIPSDPTKNLWRKKISVYVGFF